MTKCPACNNEYKSIGSHISQSDCTPSISNNTKEHVIGGLFGDATIEKTTSSARWSLSNTNEKYIKWVEKELPNWLISGVVENERGNRRKKRYMLRSVTHPYFKKLYEEWYTPQKSLPEKVKLSDTIITHWYLSDGTYNTGTTERVRIAAQWCKSNEDIIIEMWEDAGFSPTFTAKSIDFPVSESNKLLNRVKFK